MFGFRPEGRIVKQMDPIVRMTPLIMTHRNDAQVFLKQQIDYVKMDEYIKKKREQGIRITHMNIVVAAFVRTVFHMPEFNRFVVNKKIYQRNELCVSYTILKDKVDGNIVESAVKLKFEPVDTIFNVAEKMQEAITENRKIEVKNFSDKLVGFLLSIPLVPGLAVGLLKLLDRYGLLPKMIIDASPFHTTMFITNMASIRMNYVYHHIYNFGTTGIFVSMGKKDYALDLDKDGQVVKKNFMPLGIVVDERICAGAVYARGMAILERYLNHPELLEQPPEEKN